MPKKVLYSPSERVDIPDLVQSGQDFASEQQSHKVKNFILNNFARIVEGFRVEIPNQTTSPGEFTIYNGVCFDRSGQIINNEDEANSAQSYTILLDGKYYVEIIFNTVNSDSDVRAFMDPTYDNGNDPSGDPRVPGKEFSQGVSTRITPDWQIVTPVSTSGFDLIAADANSVKVPVAVIQVTGGAIVSASTSVASTVLSEAAVATDTVIHVVNSRIFPDSFQITIDNTLGAAETISVTTNDRDNGVLSLAAPLANNHDLGARVIASGGSALNFLNERVTIDLPTTGTKDARPRFFQGDETRGWVIEQDPYSVTGINDLQVANLKDYISFLSAQVRELKFGAERDDLIGKTVPPTSFASGNPRYFDRSGGIQGARSNTLSVGDGISTWGDFNVTSYANARACIQDAIDSLPTQGGIIYVKTGTYSISGSSLSVGNKGVIFAGEGGASVIQTTGAVPCFDLATGSVCFDNINIQNGGGSTSTKVINLSGGDIAYARNCVIHGITTSGAGFIGGIYEGVTFVDSGTVLQNINGKISNAIFINTNFFASSSNCITAANSSTQSKFINCTFFGASGACVQLGNANTFIEFNNCVVSSSTGFLTMGTTCADISVVGCDIPLGTNIIGLSLTGDGPHHVEGCRFVQSSNGVASSTAIYITAHDSTVHGCHFNNCDHGVEIDSAASGNSISDCVFTNDTGKGRLGVYLNDAVYTSISNCLFYQLSDTSVANMGISIDAATTTSILGCKFQNIGHTSGTGAEGSGVYYSDTGSFVDINISNCSFTSIVAKSASSAYGIHFANSTNTPEQIIISGNTFTTIAPTSGSGGNCIKIGSFKMCNISNNIISGVGNTGVTSDTSAILLGDISSGTADGDLVILGNSIKNVITNASSGISNAIKVLRLAYKTNISNNTISIDDVQVTGITVDSNSAANPKTTNVTITGNCIESANYTLYDGVYVKAQAAGEGYFVISNNNITGFSNHGIDVIMTGSDGHACINGNQVFSGIVGGSTGISLTDAVNFTCNSNAVMFSGAAAARYCIKLAGVCGEGTVTGNSLLDSNTTQYRIILAAASYNIVISSNIIQLNGSNGGIRLDDAGIVDVFVTSNSFIGAVLWPITGPGAYRSAATRDQDPAVADPTGNTDVGLNYVT